MGRRGRRCKKLLDGIKEKRKYGKLKEEASAHSVENSSWNILWSCLRTD